MNAPAKKAPAKKAQGASGGSLSRVGATLDDHKQRIEDLEYIVKQLLKQQAMDAALPTAQARARAEMEAQIDQQIEGGGLRALVEADKERHAATGTP